MVVYDRVTEDLAERDARMCFLRGNERSGRKREGSGDPGSLGLHVGLQRHFLERLYQPVVEALVCEIVKEFALADMAVFDRGLGALRRPRRNSISHKHL